MHRTAQDTMHKVNKSFSKDNAVHEQFSASLKSNKTGQYTIKEIVAASLKRKIGTADS
jgi:hypothetical protein